MVFKKLFVSLSILLSMSVLAKQNPSNDYHVANSYTDINLAGKTGPHCDCGGLLTADEKNANEEEKNAALNIEASKK